MEGNVGVVTAFFRTTGVFGKAFPVTEDGSKCVLCQQDLDHAAAHRLRQFEEFITSTTEKELRQIREDFARRRNAFTSLKTTTDAIEETIKELLLEHDSKADIISSVIAQSEKRRATVVAALTEDSNLPQDCAALASASSEVQSIAVEIDARIKSLRESANTEARKKMADEAQELRARVALGKHEQIILDEIENKKKIAAYGQCIDETKPTAITAKSSQVTKAVVSVRLKQSFKNELNNLEFNHVEVDLKEVGGAEGVFYHKLILTRNPGVEVPKIVSEGEQRCISIAAFFAELSTADDPSAIVFDDPVSSLDFEWRLNVAKRLVEESKHRQVIVFTHDVVFLLALKQYAEESSIEPLTSMSAGNLRVQVYAPMNCRGLRCPSKERSAFSRTATKPQKSFPATATKTPTNMKQNTSTACCAKHGSVHWKKFSWAGSWSVTDQGSDAEADPTLRYLQMQTVKQSKQL